MSRIDKRIAVRTPFVPGKPQSVIGHLTKLMPLERLGKPEDVANTVACLAGPACASTC